MLMLQSGIHLHVNGKRIGQNFFINDKSIEVIHQSLDYPMQLMLDLYDIKNVKNELNTFEIDYIEVSKFIDE